jgi:serine/threonine-protein kinase RsbW
MSTGYAFPADPNAPAAARRALEGVGAGVGDRLLERSGLAMTEVVTNSVQHAGLAPSQNIGLELSLGPELLRIEVSDAGPGFIPAPASSKPDQAPGGWGLWLVDQLTDRWGVDCSHSTRVWLEFDRGATAQ